MAVTYEWDIETWDPATEEILDHYHADKLEDLLPHFVRQDPTMRLVLIRETGDQVDGITSRLWAYVGDNWSLPRTFEEAGEVETEVAVPQRFHRMIAKAGG